MNNDPLEIAVGELYVHFFRLRQEKRYQEEYDAMGVLLNMLMTDREYLRETYGVNP